MNPDGYVVSLHTIVCCCLLLFVVLLLLFMFCCCCCLLLFMMVALSYLSTPGAMTDCGERIVGREFCAMVLT